LTASYPQAVVTFAGSRDGYQVPLALAEADLLDTFVTEFYWPADRAWFQPVRAALLSQAKLRARFCEELGSAKAKISLRALLAAMLNRVVRRDRFGIAMDCALGRAARRIAVRNNAALFCYSYYASEAFNPATEHPDLRFLFQIHPDPRSVRRILAEEMDRVPIARDSLSSEVELSFSDEAFDQLCSEPDLANGWVAASSFTAQTLAENGIPRQRIHVVPYGVDSLEFLPRTHPPDPDSEFMVIFVGSMIQRKGLSYLLEAARMLKTRHLRVLLCGRGWIDRRLIEHFADVNIEVQIGLPRDRLVQRIQQSDVFALPSLVEGFGLVIIECMSCGLPIIGTPHTSAPDLIEDGKQGFIVPIRSAETIAERLQWGLDHRSELAHMGTLAAQRARDFTWANFRVGMRDVYRRMVDDVRDGEPR
jgi:glycosyltransferase involved in cell wall biosynthesis